MSGAAGNALAPLVAAFTDLAPTRTVLAALRPGQERAAGGLWGSSAALLAAAIAGRGLPLLLLTGSDDDAGVLTADLSTFGCDALLLPSLAFDVDGAADPRAANARALALGRIRELQRRNAAFVLACSVDGLLQPSPDPRDLGGDQLDLAAGERLDVDALLVRLERRGLRRVPVVLGPGEVSHRGDVVDLFAYGQDEAVRLELFDDRLESIRPLDPATQRSRQPVAEIRIALVDAAATAMTGDRRQADVIDHLVRRDLVVARIEPLRLDEELRTLLELGGRRAGKVWERFGDIVRPLAQLAVSALPSQDIDFKVLSAGTAVGAGEVDPAGRLRAIRGRGGRVTIVCPSAAEQRRLADIFAHKQVDAAAEGVELTSGALARGFRVRELHWTVLSLSEFAGVPARAPARPPVHPAGRAIQSFFELGPGDLVVHAAHGIARFEGIERAERTAGAAEDFLRLLFKDDVLLLVPAAKIHLVQKYVGAGEAAPRLDKLGGKGFQRRKDEVHRALYDLAADLLEVQAQRERQARPPFPPDPLEDAFLDGFPFVDTADQQRSWREIAADLEGPRPMDRLLCGDVGFGKTELALRAAFRVAITGRQVAVLVPTTVLAEQHGEVFRQRCEPHGLTVAVLSRFRHGKTKSELLAGAAAGSIDIVVGTHRLLSQDVAFKDLGLLVIDEEQRFGVRQKEQLKRLRVSVDVLTLSATPIPRTLHAALLGVRSISTLDTPPPGRLDVETRVANRSPELLQQAIRRELARGGQVFFLHNRIGALAALARQVEQLVPEAKVAIGHGQMTETEMDKAIRSFVLGRVDVLVCTSIIENGLDIPRANTILIDDAALFGLAELHQLRGRVGRSDAQAHCYLLMDPLQPPPAAARRRLKAIEELSHLGAGFAIAMKDLEVRGAGNLLGPQQSGHIAAVGYEMYAALLQDAVAAARSGDAERALRLPEVVEVDLDLRLDAFLPDGLVAEPRARLELLREMQGAVDPAQAEAIRTSLVDRFGRLPRPVDNLLRLFLLGHLLAPLQVRAVQLIDDRLVVRHDPARPLTGGAWLDAFADVRPVEAGRTHLLLPRGRREWTGEAVLDLLTSALLGTAVPARMRR